MLEKIQEEPTIYLIMDNMRKYGTMGKQGILQFYKLKHNKKCKIYIEKHNILQFVKHIIDFNFTICYTCIIKQKTRGDDMRVAYVRVSTVEQNEARQVEALKVYDIEKCYIEKV